MADKEPYGDVPYADPGYQADKKKRYPIDTRAHAEAAWEYINHEEEASKYSSDQLSKVRERIKAAAKQFGIQISDDNDGDESKSSEPDGAVREDTPSEVRESDDAAPEGTSSERDESTNTTRKAVPMAKTIDELRARLDEISERMQELGGDETRALDHDEQTEWDGLDSEYVELATTIKNIEKRAERLKVLASGGAIEETTPPKKETVRNSGPAFHKKQDDIYNLEELRSFSYSGDDFLNKVRDNAMRAVESAKYSTPKGFTKEDAQTTAAAYLEDIDTEDRQLAKRFLVTGSKEYETAFGKIVRFGNDASCTVEERQALSRAQALGTDSGGGYAVPFQLDPTVILTNAGVTNPIRDLARQVQIVGKQWQGVTSAGVTVTRGAEGDEAGDNSFTLAQPTLSTNRVMGFVPFNIEIDLAWNALRSEITRVLVDGKAREEDSFITGDGSTGQQPGGVVGSLSGNTVTAGGTASFAAADVYALQTALDPRWEANSSFLGHKAIYHKIRQFDTAGGAQLWARIGEGRPNELLAYPAMAASAMDSTLTTGKKILLYGDFSQFLIVDRIGMSVEVVPHLFGANRRPTGQRGVYAIWMNNSKILVPSAFKLLVTG